MTRQPSSPNIPSGANLSRFLLMATVCVAVLVFKFAQEVLIPVALAVLLTFLLAPLAMRLERRRLGRVASVIIVVSAALLFIVGVGAIVFVQAEQLAKDLPTYQENFVEKLKFLKPSGTSTIDLVRKTAQVVTEQMSTPSTTQSTTQPGNATAKTNSTKFDDVKKNLSVEQPPPLGSKANPSFVIVSDQGGVQWEAIGQLLSPILSPLGTAGLVIVFTIFMLLAREDLRDRLIRLVGQGQLTVTTQALSDAADRISRYLLMQTIVNGSYGLIISLGLWIIGVPNPLLFGLLCSILRFLPYIGPLIAMTFPIIVSIGKFSGFRIAGETIGLFVGVELFSNNVMEPWLYGSSTGMSTVAILVAAVFWTWLWGPVGLLLSTPLTVILVVLGKYVPQFAFLDVLLGDEAVLRPYERFYQRLLALDSEEATELAREYRKEHSLEHVYSEILLPAIGLAERDRHGGLLEEDRELFLRTSMRDVIDELGDEERADISKKVAAQIERDAKGLPDLPPSPKGKPETLSYTEGIARPRPPRPMLPKECTINIACLPAHDESDELVNLMLAQLLEFMGYCALSVSNTKLASERVDAVESSKADLTVISALPPSAIAHARYLLKRLNSKMDTDAIIVGLWLNTADIKRSRERLSPASNLHVTTSLSDALDQIHQMAQPAITKRLAERENAEQQAAK